MRYDKAIYFQTITAGNYDESTGDYGDPTITEVKRLASVQQTNTQPKGEYSLRLEYGIIKEKSLTVYLLNAYKEPFDRIRIGDRLYEVKASLLHRSKQVFIVSEIQTPDTRCGEMTEGP